MPIKKNAFGRPAFVENLLQPGAGTISPDIISSLITGGSDGGGGHTSESIMSSVTRIMPARSGGSVRDDLFKSSILLDFFFLRDDFVWN